MNFIQRLFNKPYDQGLEELKHYNDPCYNITWLDKYIYPESGGRCTQEYYTVQNIYNNINGIELVKLLKSYRIVELNLKINKMSNDLIICNIDFFSQLFFGRSICDDFLNDLVKNLFLDIESYTVSNAMDKRFSVFSTNMFENKTDFSINIHFTGRISIIKLGQL